MASKLWSCGQDHNPSGEEKWRSLPMAVLPTIHDHHFFFPSREEGEEEEGASRFGEDFRMTVRSKEKVIRESSFSTSMRKLEVDRVWKTFSGTPGTAPDKEKM